VGPIDNSISVKEESSSCGYARAGLAGRKELLFDTGYRVRITRGRRDIPIKFEGAIRRPIADYRFGPRMIGGSGRASPTCSPAESSGSLQIGNDPAPAHHVQPPAVQRTGVTTANTNSASIPQSTATSCRRRQAAMRPETGTGHTYIVGVNFAPAKSASLGSIDYYHIT